MHYVHFTNVHTDDILIIEVITLLRFRTDVLPLLKEKGYSSYNLRKNNILAQSTIQKLREHKMISSENLNWLCEILSCQPGNLIEYVPDNNNADEE